MEIATLVDELVKRDNSFKIKWHYLSKMWSLEIPWLDKQYWGKTLEEVLGQAVADE